MTRSAGPTSSPATSRPSASPAASSATTRSRPRPRTRRRRSCCSSAIAARTERLRLGTGVFLGALHHPMHICEQVSTLDQISNGRAVLGRRHRLPALRVRGLRLAVRAAGPAAERDARDPAQRLDDGQLPLRRRVLPLRRPRAVPAVRAAAPPADLRRRHVRGGDRAGGPARRHVVHACRWRRCDYVQDLADRTGRRARRYGTTPRICLMREALGGDQRRRRRGGVVRPGAVVPPLLLGDRHARRPRRSGAAAGRRRASR